MVLNLIGEPVPDGVLGGLRGSVRGTFPCLVDWSEGPRLAEKHVSIIAL